MVNAEYLMPVAIFVVNMNAEYLMPVAIFVVNMSLH